MDISRIYELIGKYTEGNTTLEEEKYLREWIQEAGPALPADLLPFRNQFELFSAAQDIPVDIYALNNSILDRINDFETQNKPEKNSNRFSRLLIAASLAAVVGLAGFFLYRTGTHRETDTYADPQMAYLETQKALLFVSQQMNKGIEPLSNVTKINTGQDQLRTLERMDESLGMLNLVSFINKSSNLKK
ncbi:MAG: hypothetical protein JXQ80_04710 [Bacteroidales bacterium]|nr:hypothetical protein [Bacteroidales bacterium]